MPAWSLLPGERYAKQARSGADLDVASITGGNLADDRRQGAAPSSADSVLTRFP
jgi:hypothetical protein